ncbi:MAG: sigma 54-interacting transcriptional regulator [Planctomycetota bacterium]
MTRLSVLAEWDGSQPVDLEDLLRRAMDEVTRLVAADRGTLYLVDHARSELVSRVAHLPELAEIRLRLGEGVAGWVAQSGEAVNVPHGTQDPRFARRIDELTGYRTESMLALPVRDAGGTTIGVLQLLNKQGGAFQDEDEELLAELGRELAALLSATSLRSQLHPAQRQPLSFRFNHIVGESPAMQAVYDRTARAARTDATVLVRGESGAGKEAIARAVHYNSPRAPRAFLKVDCAALPHDLIENELFGHEKGAFTGADRAALGKVDAAAGGTLFLDEVGELPAPVQGKLLRLLQERTFLRVGGAAPIKVDLRFVCATHRDLEAEVAAGRFRQDLYYRMRVVEIEVPPLRERGAADLDRLVDHFWFELARRHGRPGLRLTRAARARLHAHDWPGNVRELEHCLESALVLAAGEEVGPGELPIGPSAAGAGEAGPAPAGPSAPGSSAPGPFTSGLRPFAAVELAYLRWALERCGGNKAAAARALGIGRNTLQRKLAADPEG